MLNLVGVVAIAAAPAASAETVPQRVVSMNVCTDQLAMLLAPSGQLISISSLARDADYSMLAEAALAYPINYGRAEEIHQLQPDLVLAGTFTTRSTVAMLRRLGIRVEEFAPEASLADIPSNLQRMGKLLGREHEASDLVAAFDARLAGLASEPSDIDVAIYEPDSYALGPGTLAHAVVEAAGLTNVADALGVTGMGRVPLEVMVMHAPDILVTTDDGDEVRVRAEENFAHPAFRRVAATSRTLSLPGPHWVCGGPFTLDAIELLQDAAADIAVGRP